MFVVGSERGPVEKFDFDRWGERVFAEDLENEGLGDGDWEGIEQSGA